MPVVRALWAVLALAPAACTDQTDDDDGAGANAPADGGAGGAGSGGGGADAIGGGGRGGAGGGPEGPTIPTYFRLRGEAEGSENGVDVSCSLDFIFDLDVATYEGGMLRSEGVHGGDAIRVILDEEGAGFAFNASSAGMVVATLDPDTGELRLAIPLNETAENRFWKELALLPGTLDAEGNAAGTWTCAPLDIEQGGYVDTTVTVPGTWQAELLKQE